MAEADRDRLQLIKEKEALLQELQLIIQQRRSAEDVTRLEEERRRLEEEIQRARATSAQGATERWAALQRFRGRQDTASSEEPIGKTKWMACMYLECVPDYYRLNMLYLKCMDPKVFLILEYLHEFHQLSTPNLII
jgi:hypothetical protein